MKLGHRVSTDRTVFSQSTQESLVADHTEHLSDLFVQSDTLNHHKEFGNDSEM